MTGPLALPPTAVLTAVLAGVMVLTALYCAGRLVVAPLLGRASEPGVDLLHVVMGSVMAATLLGLLSRRWDVVWVVGFGVAALWYLREGVVRASRHSLQHGLGCVAMLAMLLAGSTTSYAGGLSAGHQMPGMGEMPGMGGVGRMALSTPSAVLLLGLGLAVLALTAADTVQVGRGGTAAVAGGGRRALAPRCATGCRVAMGVAMGVALLAMV